MQPGGTKDGRSKAGLLARLARDTAGNTMALVAAAIVPLAGMIGSGVDMGRAYLAESKLQNACDAAALATRRAMGGGTLTQAAREEGERFFAFNFPPGVVNAEPVDLTIRTAAADLSVVEVTAATAIPTTIMRILGQDRIAISINCSADQDYVNNDIMLVLDVTGSMFCTAGNMSCTGPSTEQPNSRLSRLRAATRSLYRALQDARGVRIRYGFMPYSTNVNVGADLNRNWLRNPADYWQRSNNQWVSRSVNHNNGWFNNTWNRCIEERSTISLNTSPNIRISADVQQADIDTVSTTDNRLKWVPHDPAATHNEGSSPCPAPARRLATYGSEAAFQAQVDAALARVGGNTNHDVGMVWGMRFLSGTGMFAADNPNIFNDMRVDRHVIFMTDGDMTAASNVYTAYGLANAEVRLQGTGNQEQRHIARFFAACNRARQMGMTVWVIALDVPTPGEVRPCASGDDQFFQSNGSDLDTVFTQIGRGIGRLRMTQ